MNEVFFRCIVAERKIFWTATDDDYEGIIAQYKLERLDRQLVRVELSSQDEKTGIDLHFNRWHFKVHQRELPSWFDEKEVKQRVVELLQSQLMLGEVDAFCGSVLFLAGKIRRLVGFSCVRYMLADAEVDSTDGAVYIHQMLHSARINTGYNRLYVNLMSGNARIGELTGYGVVKTMDSSSMIDDLTGHARVGYMKGQARINNVEFFATVGSMTDCSVIDHLEGMVGKMGGDSRIQTVGGEGVVRYMGGQSRVGVCLGTVCSRAERARVISVNGG